MAERRRVLVALVVPEPARAEIDGLRRALSSRDLDRISPHITLVPPTNVSAERAGELDAHLLGVARHHGALMLDLGPTALFTNRHPVLYLEVADPDGAVGRLAGELAGGPLAGPFERPARPFVPHLTLSTTLGPEDAERAAALLAPYSASVRVEALTLLHQERELPAHPWRVVEEVRLGRPASRGRGGRELTFHLVAVLPGISGGHLGAELRDGERVVARAALLEVAAGLVVEELDVIPAERGLGVGRQLLGFLEKLALERGRSALAVSDVRSPGFLLACGYRFGALGLVIRELSR